MKKRIMLLSIFILHSQKCLSAITSAKFNCNIPAITIKGTAAASSNLQLLVENTFPTGLPYQQILNVSVNSDGSWSSYIPVPTTIASPYTISAISSTSIDQTTVVPNCNPSNLLVNNTFSRSEDITKTRAEVLTFSNSRLGVEGLTHIANKVNLVVDENTNNEKIVSAKVFGHRWYAVLSKLSVGQHTLKTVATTPDGNKIILNNKFINNTSNHIIIKFPARRIIKDLRPTINGSTRANATVEVFIDDSSIGSTISDSNGNWHLRVPFNLTQGDHKIKVVSVDTNNSRAQENDLFLVDVSTFIKINQPVKNIAINETRPTISGITHRKNNLTIFVDGSQVGRIKNSLAHWSFKLPLLTNGLHKVRVKAVNDKGGVGRDRVDFTVNSGSRNIE